METIGDDTPAEHGLEAAVARQAHVEESHLARLLELEPDGIGDEIE